MDEKSPPAMSMSNVESTALKEFFGSYVKLTAHCFDSCIHDFTTRKILPSENSCTMNCANKYLNVTQKINQRFQEYMVASGMQGMKANPLQESQDNMF